jgi:toxin ParE1/3/4
VKQKPLVLRVQADGDVQEAVDYYRREGGEKVALAFIDSLQRAFRQVRQRPSGGSPRYGHDLSLPDLRHWAVRRYPYLIFYVEREEVIDVWRVLHAHRDIPSWMRPDDEP